MFGLFSSCAASGAFLSSECDAQLFAILESMAGRIAGVLLHEYDDM